MAKIRVDTGKFQWILKGQKHGWKKITNKVLNVNKTNGPSTLKWNNKDFIDIRNG